LADNNDIPYTSFLLLATTGPCSYTKSTNLGLEIPCGFAFPNHAT